MVPGRLLHYLFPDRQFTTHCAVNRMARSVLRISPLHHYLPSIKTINYYEGMEGVDGLWIKHKHLPSQSAYNPETNQGNGLIKLQDHFQEAVAVWPSRNLDEIGKRLAYLSHTITDLCTPPHQHGQYVPLYHNRWYFLVDTINDWTDREPSQWLDRHALFEVNLMVRSLFKPFANQAKLYTQLINEYLCYRTKRSEILLRFMREQIVMIRRLNVYQEYLRYGWTQKIEKTMRLVVVPTTVSLVATFWYLAAKEGRRLRKTHFTVTSNHPLIAS